MSKENKHIKLAIGLKMLEKNALNPLRMNQSIYSAKLMD